MSSNSLLLTGLVAGLLLVAAPVQAGGCKRQRDFRARPHVSVRMAVHQHFRGVSRPARPRRAAVPAPLPDPEWVHELRANRRLPDLAHAPDLAGVESPVPVQADEERALLAEYEALFGPRGDVPPR
jgi:hypothetical protein